MTPLALVELLNDVFLCFDGLVEKHALEKIKTIGDCYMVASGVPRSRPDHATVLVQLALEMREAVAERTFGGRKLTFRIGINSGPVVAGVIGRKKFIYDLWGDTVNTASRMESHGVPNRVQVSEATANLLGDAYELEPRGEIHGVADRGALTGLLRDTLTANSVLSPLPERERVAAEGGGERVLFS